MRSQTTPLPFAKPSIDAATIAAVGSVLASGWITSGPKVLEFEDLREVVLIGHSYGGMVISGVATAALTGGMPLRSGALRSRTR